MKRTTISFSRFAWKRMLPMLTGILALFAAATLFTACGRSGDDKTDKDETEKSGKKSEKDARAGDRKSRVYRATCGLIRQRVSEESGILPPGYVNVPKANIEKLFKSRAVLEETMTRLCLPYTAEQIYDNISVTSDKNGDYYYVSAIFPDPVLAAALANTLSDVFVDEYKKLIRGNLEDLNDSYVKTLNGLEKELAGKNETLKLIKSENNITDIDNDIAFNNQRLLAVEDQLTRSVSSLESAKQAMYALQGELANTDEEIVSYREESASDEDELIRAEVRLYEYEQVYAKNNPILIQQRELVRKLRADLEKARQEEAEKKEKDGEKDVNRKVVIVRNPAYTQILVNIAAKKAEIASLTNEINLNNEIAIQLRARRELLAKNHTDIDQIMTDIDQIKRQIATIRAQTATIRNFLDRSYSDISVQELAKAPDSPLENKKK